MTRWRCLAAAVVSLCSAATGLQAQDAQAGKYHAALSAAVSGDLDRAEVEFRDVLKADRLHIASRRALELVSDLREGHVNAEAFARILEGMTLQGARDLKGARRAYEQALEFQPGYYYTLHNLGVALFDAGDNDGAITRYESAISANPDYPYTHNNLGLALARAGNPEAAIPHYQRALTLYPDYHKAMHNLGVSLRDAGRRDDARTMFVKALKLKPDYVLAQAGLIYEGFAAPSGEGTASSEAPPPPAALLAVVETGSTQARARAVELLVRNPAPDTGPSTLPLLTHERAVIRAAAASVFRAVRLEAAVAPLIALLRKDPDWVVRGEAAAALAEAGDSRAHAALLKAVVADKESSVRRFAALSLARYEGCPTAKALRRAQRDRILDVRRAAEESIRYLGGDSAVTGPPEADPWLVDVCGAPEAAVR